MKRCRDGARRKAAHNAAVVLLSARQVEALADALEQSRLSLKDLQSLARPA